ncbi:unnamed protein product, partial [Ectocarpus sp. 12 AP-2014]
VDRGHRPLPRPSPPCEKNRGRRTGESRQPEHHPATEHLGGKDHQDVVCGKGEIEHA